MRLIALILLLIGLAIRLSAGRELNFVPAGCYMQLANSSKPVLRFHANEADVITNASCAAECSNMDKDRFGVIEGKQCLCDTSTNNAKRVAVKHCLLPCPKNKSQRCDSNKAIFVYKIRDESDGKDDFFVWNIWSPWSACSQTCGSNAKQTRTRQCQKIAGLLTEDAEPDECPGKTNSDEARSCGIMEPCDVQLLGCFKDDTDKDLPETFNGGIATTREFCVAHCKRKNFKYAATQAGKWCQCGDSYGKYGKVADSECSMPCTGNANETCGNDLRNLIFETGVIKNISTIGCFKDNHDMDVFEMLDGGNLTSRHFCLAYCIGRNFKYAGVQIGHWCHCSDSYGKFGQVSDSECSMPCAGDPRETCGNYWRNLVYKADVTFECQPKAKCWRDADCCGKECLPPKKACLAPPCPELERQCERE